MQSMETSNIVDGVRKLLQNLVAPELKAVDARLAKVKALMDAQHKSVMNTLDQHKVQQATIEAFRAEFRAEMQALRAQSQVELMRETTPFRERVAAVENR